MDNWISVNESMPELKYEFGGFALVSDNVKAISKSKGEVVADWSTMGWCDTDGDDLDDITHWIAFPEGVKW